MDEEFEGGTPQSICNALLRCGRVCLKESLPQAICYSSFIADVDPVATLAAFGKLQVRRLLTWKECGTCCPRVGGMLCSRRPAILAVVIFALGWTA